jgi:transketolase
MTTKAQIIKRLKKQNLNLENYIVSYDTIETTLEDRDEDNAAIKLLSKALLGLNWHVITTAGGYQIARIGKAIDSGEYCDKASAHHY